MNKISQKSRKFGAKAPRETKRAKLIGKAVNKAVREYKDVYKKLAWE